MVSNGDGWEKDSAESAVPKYENECSLTNACVASVQLTWYTHGELVCLKTVIFRKLWFVAVISLSVVRE